MLGLFFKHHGVFCLSSPGWCNFIHHTTVSSLCVLESPTPKIVSFQCWNLLEDGYVALAFQIAKVLVDRCERGVPEKFGDLLKARCIPSVANEASDVVKDFLLTLRQGHGSHPPYG